jgi:hypothetical protein
VDLGRTQLQDLTEGIGYMSKIAKLGDKVRVVSKDDPYAKTVYVVSFKDWYDGVTLFDEISNALESVKISWSNADPKAVVRVAYAGKWNISVNGEVIGFITAQTVLKKATHL